jgi:DNA-binding NarL/FixJ family response regulator
MIAGWIMVHKSGAEGIAIAGQAVELARTADAHDIELHARVTLGLLQADSGDVDGGIAGVEEVRRQVSDQRAPLIISRTYGNLSSVLEGAGRSAEAVRISTEGLALIGDQVVNSTRAWLLGNEGESLFMLARYEDSAVRLAAARRAVEGPLLCAGVEMFQGFLALARGDIDAAAAYHASAAEGFRYDTQPQHQIPLRGLGLRVAVAQGRYEDARRMLLAAIDAGFPNGTARYAWPLLAAGAAAEADGPWPLTGDPARGQVLERIRTAARETPRPAPVHEAYALLVDAELARAEGRHEPELWAAAEAAFEKEERPVELAAVRYRHGEALLARGADARAAAGCLLSRAHAAAVELGAKPLAAEVAALAQRARLPLDAPPPEPAPAEPADPADSLGLTARERDVLRLVAEGRTNRQIAEELFISPKTASVHVSNILAKLAVATRGEAAALSHRLHLFTPAG